MRDVHSYICILLQELFYKTANIFQAHAFFYQSHPSVVNKHAPVENVPALFVYKESLHYNFTGESIEARERRFYRSLNSHALINSSDSTRRTRSERRGKNERDVVQVGERGTLSDVSESDEGEYKSIVFDEQESRFGGSGGKPAGRGRARYAGVQGYGRVCD